MPLKDDEFIQLPKAISWWSLKFMTQKKSPSLLSCLHSLTLSSLFFGDCEETAKL
jgi:hypothetical protein